MAIVKTKAGKSKAKATSGSSPSKASASKKKGKTTKKAAKTARKKAVAKTPEKKLTKRQAAKKRADEKLGKGGGSASVDNFLDRIRKMDKFKGVAQVEKASVLDTPYRLRRPTGIMGLDIALGGGFHAGGSAQVYGSESVGKTHLAFRTAGEIQRIYGSAANILIVSTEIRIDKSFARKANFRVPYAPSEVDLFNKIRKQRGQPLFDAAQRTDLLKEVGNVVIVTASTGEKALDAAYEALVEGVFQLVIIESLGALLSADQEAGDVGDRTYGGSSVMLTNFMNKVYPLYMMDRIAEDGTRSMLETTIIGINQARAELGAVGHQKKTHAAAGAFSWKHAQLASVELSKSKPIRAQTGKPPIGREVKWELTKGKAGTHDGKKGLYDYYHVPKDDPVFWSEVELNSSQWGIDTLTNLAEAAKDIGAVDVSGSWIKWEENGKLIWRGQGADNFAELLVNNEELVGLLRKRCIEVADIPVVFR